MKKIVLSLVSIFSLTFAFSNNNNEEKIVKALQNYVVEQEADSPFDFDYKSYLPKDFMAYDLSKNNLVSLVLIDEEQDEPFDFDHKQYLPVGFNPKKELNQLFLYPPKMIDEEVFIKPPFCIKKNFGKVQDNS
ncbi:MAG: hypothetical protein COX71_06505 [Flavobacteriales bacterium CG_4_10_14_0_2_um_filter_35_18]|nr:MAG: hypothetical protein COX71_06505 [Flavobacteriales bacterium CG_4_10_14_0_2_um_filter_35_18]